MIAVLILITVSGAAFAQKEALRPAPVPGLGPTTVSPADRAGRSDTSDNAAPFAAAPTGAVAGSGQATPHTTGKETRDAAPTPSLSR